MLVWCLCEEEQARVPGSVGCIYAPDKVNPNIFQFYLNFSDIFHHTSMHPLFLNFYEF